MKNWVVAIVILLLTMIVGNVFAYNSKDDDVSPSVAYGMVNSDGNVYILDVRTPEEWYWVGHPGMNGKDEGSNLKNRVLNISYEVYHEGHSKGDELIVNNHFVKDVEKALDKDVVIITMCRSGGRSVKALEALEAAGFKSVYNMVTGFEGKTDAAKYRSVNGWKVDGLPYNFSAEGMYQD